MERAHLNLLLATAVLLLATLPPAGAAPTARTKRISVRSNGNEATGGISAEPDISANGRYVVFSSEATNLVSNDTNDADDVFIHDRRTKKTRRLSVTSSGQEAEVGGESSDAEMSGNGRYVVFSSNAEELVPNDDNLAEDVFVHDRKTKKTRRVSVKSNGGQAEDGASGDPEISDNGRYVVFTSSDEDLVAGDDNGVSDIFVHDRTTKKTRRVNLASNGDQAELGSSSNPAISPNGRVVVFDSDAENLVQNDDNAQTDVFIHVRRTKKTRRVSVTSNGGQASGGSSSHALLSRTGRIVVYESHAVDLVPGDGNAEEDIFVYDRRTKKTRLITRAPNGDDADGGSEDVGISSDARFITYESHAENLVGNDDNTAGDSFLYDRQTKKTRRISLRSNGNQTLLGSSDDPDVSDDGRFVAFESNASDMVANDQNTFQDVFVRGPLR